MAALLVMAAVPPVSKDALTHHLAVPKLYVDHGRMLELHNVRPSYYPMNLDMLYLIPLLWENDILPKYIHMLFGLLTAVVVYRYLRFRLNRLYGIMGALLFLSLPIVIQLSITVYVDLGLVFFSTAALAALLKWRENESLHWLLAAAVSCGFALGTKYNALVVFLLLVLIVPIVAKERASSTALPSKTFSFWDTIGRPTGVFVLVSVLFFSPWLLRNYLWTGNPLYPLYDSFFNPQDPYIYSRLSPFAIRKLVYGESLWETLLVPLRIFFQGQDNVPALFDGRLNPFLLPLAIVGMFNNSAQHPPIQFEKRVWGWFAVLFILIVFFTRDMRIRYIAPAIPPMVILSVFGLQNLFSRSFRISGRYLRLCVSIGTASLLVILLLMNSSYLLHKWQEVRPMDYLSGKLDREAYISRYRPEYPLIATANQRLMAGDRVLCVFLGNRRYYFDVDSVFFEWAQFQALFERAATPEQIATQMKQMGISHVMIGLDGLAHWSRRTMTVEDQAKLHRWISEYMVVLDRQNGIALYELGPP